MSKITKVFVALTAIVLHASATPTNRVPLCARVGVAQSNTLIHQGKSYGIFGNLLIKECTAQDELKLGYVGELTVLELQHIENQTALDIEAWEKTVVRDLSVVWRGLRRVVVSSLPRDAVLPQYTVVLPVLETPMTSAPHRTKTQAILQSQLDNLQVEEVIEKLILEITEDGATKYLNYLTGVTSNIKTRNSIAPDGMDAAIYLGTQFKSFGFDVQYDQFRPDYNPNVIARINGTVDPDTIVVVGAHYDSRGVDRVSKTAPAPGANDDGSGTQFLLQLAEVIHRTDTQFKYTIIIGAWGGEEQGLVGSRAYAQACKEKNYNILAMLQADMIAFRKDGEGIQCGFPDRYADVLLTDLSKATMNLYTPHVETCYTSVCCSDHQSFYEQGFSATQFFERCGSIADDKYHDAGDIVNRKGYDLEGQLLDLSRGVAAVALTLLEPTSI